MAAHSLRAVLATVLIACAAPDVQTRGKNEFKAVVPDLHNKAKATSVPDVIIIDVLPNTRGANNFTYIPSELNVIPGTKVAWVSWGGFFTLKFNAAKSAGPWPFQEPPGDISPTNTSPPYFAVRTVKTATPAPPPSGYYHFRVELSSSPGTPPFATDPECPPIIIN
jgi:hypothetical protein